MIRITLEKCKGSHTKFGIVYSHTNATRALTANVQAAIGLFGLFPDFRRSVVYKKNGDLKAAACFI